MSEEEERAALVRIAEAERVLNLAQQDFVVALEAAAAVGLSFRDLVEGAPLGEKLADEVVDKPPAVWIELPVSVDLAAAVGKAVVSVWPSAVIDTAHGRPGNWLCIRKERG